MFKIIKFEPSSLKLYSLIPKILDEKKHNFDDLKTDKILEHENFERTFAGIGLNNILDLEKRSSWTHKLKFRLEFPTEAHEFMKQNNIFFFSIYSSFIFKHKSIDTANIPTFNTHNMIYIYHSSYHLYINFM